ncbi:MAG: efflux RND transporter permease subunit [Beijerinckiaceae bacterium]|nr:efflux RND transporter permease subunit [Beijerinckiaceae bacterium]
MGDDMQAAETPAKANGFNLSRWAIENPSITRFLVAVIVIAGALGLMNIGQKEDPDFTFRVMIVEALWPGASLADMQDQVVNKIERKLQETPHLDYVHSFTRPGSAIITVSIKGDTTSSDVSNAFYQVRKKVGDIANELPTGLLGPYFNDEFGDTFITLHAITGDGYSFPELKVYAKAARDKLLRVPGVEKVSILGDQDQKIHIDVSSKVLAERSISALDIQNAIKGQNNVDSAGNVETATRSVRVSVDGDLRSAADVADLRLKAGKDVIRLGDIAKVTDGLEDPFTRKYRFNGKDAVEIGVVMARGFNVTTVGADVHKALASFEGTLPAGVEIGQISDQPEVVRDAIHEFAEALIEALAIVLAVSFLSIGWRAGLVVAITIPLVLAATFAIMYEMGIDLQRISLGALIIALGLLVDDAMIAVEMMERKLEEGFGRLEAASFAYRSTAFPMLTGTLITTAGFIPVGFAASTAGEYVRTLFYVVGIALVVSWFAAVFFTPWIGHSILKERKANHDAPHHDVYETPFYRALRATVAWCVDRRGTVLALTLGAFVIAIVAFGAIPKDFFPQSARPEILVDLWLPEGTSTKETEAQAKAFEAKMLRDPDQRLIATYVGEGAPRFVLTLDQQLGNPNFAQLLVMARDVPSRERLIVKMRGILAQDFPSIRSKVDRLFLGPPVGWPVQMRVVGPDRDEVRKIAEQVADVYRQDPRLGTIHTDWLEPVTTMKLTIDQARARALGVSSQRIRQTVQASLSGVPLADIRDGEETISIVLRQPESERTVLSAVESTYVASDLGGAVPVSQVARVVPVLEPGIEWRRDRLPTVTVRATIPDGVQATEISNRIFAQLAPLRASLKPGYTIAIQGASEDSAESQGSIAAKAPIMLFTILVLLMIQLRHFGKAMLVLVTGPLGIIGAAAALLVTGSPFGFVAILGVIALLGIIMRNSVILLDQIGQDIDSGLDPVDAVIGSAVRRFRPIMLTAAAAVLALIPITRSVFWGPLAYAMMGGIIVATALTILVLPASYAFFFRLRRVTKVAKVEEAEQFGDATPARVG